MKKTLTDTERIAKLEESVYSLKNRCRQLERLTQVMAYQHEKQFMGETGLRLAAARANCFSNAFREVKNNLQEHGNEFDKEPHLPEGIWD